MLLGGICMKISKKLLTFIMALFVTVFAVAFSSTANAEDISYYSYTVKNSTATIKNVDSSISGDVIVPSVIDGYEVVAIADNAFLNCVNITSIEVPDSVTSIGKGAFNGVNNLESMTIPFVGSTATSSGINGILGYIFGYTTTETEGTVKQGYSTSTSTKYCYTYIPESLKSITVTGSNALPSYAFNNCANIETVVLSNATSIGSNAFDGCVSLKDFKFPSQLQKIGGYAFRNCVLFKEITVPDSVTSIGLGAFNGINNLESITLPFIGSTATSSDRQGIFGYIFDYEVSEIEGTVPQLYNYGSYSYCYIPQTLRKVTITTDATISSGAFSNCSFLTEINIPDTTTSIGGYAFYNCSNISDLDIPDTVTTIGSYAFYNCD